MERDRDGGGERRAGAGQRVRIEALVAVGETSGGGFEAESIDMSPEGMRLRTAYLPRVGDALICRFDGLGKELVVEGEVCWRAEQARGGEFGLRFTGLDAEAEEAVRAMCACVSVDGGPAGGGPAATVPSGAARGAAELTQRGARVRLHIDGLGSPMKARVRACGMDDLEVGSNLEFLKVGRSLELEEVDQGTRREAYIDHVKVEIDPATSVPQLVVTLRYDAPPAVAVKAKPRGASGSLPPARPAAAHEGGAAARRSEAPGRPSEAPGRPSEAPGRPSEAPARGQAEAAASGRASEAPGRAQAHGAPGRASEAPARGQAEAAAARASGGPAAEEHDDQEPQDVDVSPVLSAREPREAGATLASAEDMVPSSAGPGAPEDEGAERAEGASSGRLRDVGEKAARAGKAVAGTIGPVLAGAGARATTAMAGILARIRKRRAALAEGSGKEGGPRRKTAPPPAGALKSEGRRLVREDAEEAGEPPAEAPAFNKKAAVLGSFLGLAAVLVVFGAARLLGLRGGAETAAETTGTAPALPAASGAAAMAQASPGGAAQATPGGALTAEVPLFGATPLSTTEPVPPTPPPDASGRAGDPLAEAAGAAMPGGPGADDDDDEASGDDEQEDAREWGQGVVRNPIVLKLKMDGPIEELNGAAGAMGFTVSLPDRRALSSGSGLARKDKRIASVRVVNTAHGAEVTLQFKDGVPAYKARAKGDRLEIALGKDEPKKVAAKSKKDKKKDDDKKKKGEKDKER
ncbi:PilZ domain-containing protein [Sorangium cellulosum]|uniref:PilZ domain-containing protein n=1 Tax=Sorangium cellulosum TaxID=56 RepID=UPI0013317EA2|nr:PilZ domain-containing protein [Sorangium cellulosum]